MARSEGSGRRRRRSAQAWQGLVDGFATSGLGVGAYCQRAGVSPASFYRWRSLLERSGEGAAGFVDLGSIGRDATAPGAVLAVSPLELRLDLGGGLVLHLVRG